MSQPTFIPFNPVVPYHGDVKTFAMALLKKPYRQSTKRNMPRRWFDELPHTHVALDDAIGQGALFCNMLQESLRT